jgi:hypothetical protein
MAGSLNISVLCGVLAFAVVFRMRDATEDSFVQRRLLEQWDKCTLDKLNAFKKRTNGKDTYMRPVLFPLDLLFMSFFGVFLAFGSFGAITSIEVMKRWTNVIWIAPTAYVAADFIEDAILYAILASANLRIEELLRRANVITKIKIVMASVASMQTFGLSVIALVVGWLG